MKRKLFGDRYRYGSHYFGYRWYSRIKFDSYLVDPMPTSLKVTAAERWLAIAVLLAIVIPILFLYFAKS